MCSSKNLLTDFVPHKGHRPDSVTISDGSKIPIVGYGTLVLKVIGENNLNYRLTLHDVTVIPQLSVNLISVHVLSSAGVSVTFTQGC